MKVNVQAADLRSKLFDLINEFKSLQMRCWSLGKKGREAADQIDGVACHLASIHESLPDIFTDAHRDEKDQAFAITS